MKIAAPRSVIQFLNEPLKGLLAQVLSVEGDKLKCLCRNVEGQAQFFDAPAADGYAVIGLAMLGPKSLQAQPEPPPPLNPHELLEPLPANVQPVPMNEDQIPNATPLPGRRPQKVKLPSIHRRKKLRAGLRTTPTPPPPGSPEPPKSMFTARVRNGLGDEVVVTVAVREGLHPHNYTGPAILKAINLLPKARPYKVLDWRPVEPVQEAPAEPAVAPTSEPVS